MFTSTVLSASVFATLASAGPLMMRPGVARDSVVLGGSSLGGLSSGSSLGGGSFGGSDSLSSGSEDLSSLFDSGSVSNIWQFDNSEFDSSSISLSEFSSSMSFDHFGGLSSFSGFDNFYGKDNFCGLSNTQTVLQSESIQCESVQIDFIQQQLAIITEYAKRVILSSVCEVETQTVVTQQWLSTLQVFSSDIRHESVSVSESSSSREVTFDSHVASFISDICESDGTPIYKDFGFSGTDIGSSCATISGFNWNDQTSPSSVQSAFSACNDAAGFSISPPSSSDISSSCGSDCSFIPSSWGSSSSSSLPPSSSSYGSSYGSSSLPPSSSYGSSSYGSGSISELPPSSCSGSDCGSSVSSLPPTCSGSDCGSSVSSLPPTCSGSDCGSSVSSLPPTCSGSDCGSSVSQLPPSEGSLPPSDGSLSSGDVATLSSGDIATDSAGGIAALPTDAGAAPVATLASLTPVDAAAPTTIGSV